MNMKLNVREDVLVLTITFSPGLSSMFKYCSKFINPRNLKISHPMNHDSPGKGFSAPETKHSLLVGLTCLFHSYN